MKFSGPEITSADTPRLNRQIAAIYNVMQDGEWRTVAEIQRLTGYAATSISAQLRNLRKPECGGYTVKSERKADKQFYYRLLPPSERKQRKLF